MRPIQIRMSAPTSSPSGEFMGTWLLLDPAGGYQHEDTGRSVWEAYIKKIMYPIVGPFGFQTAYMIDFDPGRTEDRELRHPTLPIFGKRVETVGTIENWPDPAHYCGLIIVGARGEPANDPIKWAEPHLRGNSAGVDPMPPDETLEGCDALICMNQLAAGGYCDIRVIVRKRFFKYWKDQFSGDMDWPVLEIPADEVQEHVRKRLEKQAQIASSD